MALKDRIPPTRAVKGPRCDTCQFIDDLDPDDRATLEGWFLGPAQTVAIRAELVSEFGEGAVPSDFSLGRHRNGKCLKQRTSAA